MNDISAGEKLFNQEYVGFLRWQDLSPSTRFHWEMKALKRKLK